MLSLPSPSTRIAGQAIRRILSSSFPLIERYPSYTSATQHNIPSPRQLILTLSILAIATLLASRAFSNSALHPSTLGPRLRSFGLSRANSTLDTINSGSTFTRPPRLRTAARAMTTDASPSGPNDSSKIDLSDRRWDSMGLKMDRFHAYFRMEYRQIYALADRYKEEGLTLQAYLRHAKEFHQHLHMHHNIEEQYVFPVLASRMPEFKAGSGAHLKQHEQIHEGLDRYMAYIDKCYRIQSEYRPEELRSILDSFAPVLFKHLDEEVESLKGPNMSKYWTLEEIARLPM